MIDSFGSREGATDSRTDRRVARTAIARLALVGCALLISHESNAGGAATDLLDVRQAPAAVASIDTSTRVRQQLPDTLFGFNVQHFNFENDLWIDEKSRTDPRVIEALKFFPGALYRYPGGLVANRFSWQEAVGPRPARKPQKIVAGDAPRSVMFGPEEYLDFVRSVDGQPLYVLNLVGWDEQRMINELPAKQIDSSNAGLATLIKKRTESTGQPRYYELGNELDRSEYQWPNDKYIERARGTIEAIRAVDRDARFVAFLREFDWHYRDDARKGEVSSYQTFITDVLTALPSVQAFSMHFYYDQPGESRKATQLPWRLDQFQRAIDVARRARHGQAPEVWITEHARGVNQQAGKVMQQAALTSNLSATLSTADFLIALAQVPEVRGAAWHALNGNAWQLFDASIRYKDLRPRPVYWGLRVLRALNLPVVLATVTSSPNVSGSAGGYDVRAVGFASEDQGQLGLWAVNRSAKATELELNVATWKNRPVEVRHFHFSGEPGVDPDDPDVKTEMELSPAATSASFSATGTLKLHLPPSSVSSFLISAPVRGKTTSSAP
jgi:alpha-L-arabinofuranosidase